jgi:hypothetical protein
MLSDRIEIPFNGQSFFLEIAEGKMVSLNRVFEIAGSPKNNDPRQWVRLISTKKLMDSMNVEKIHILKSRRGEGGGTWAHWQLALAYAKYLSPELHIVINQVFKDRLEEIIDPELGIDRSTERARKRWRSQGKSEEWIAERERGKLIRDEYEKTLVSHQVKPGSEIGFCTNKIYQGLFRKDRNQIENDLRTRLPKLPQKINLRDYKNTTDLAAIGLAEALSSEKIEKINALGVDQCAKVSFEKATDVRLLLADSRSKDNAIAPPVQPKKERDKEKNKRNIQALKDALKGK